ncbi:hypothetical protein SVIOM74S_01266 [Streptomyces violarus]
MLPAVSAPAFENTASMDLKLCAPKGGWHTKSPTPQPEVPPVVDEPDMREPRHSAGAPLARQPDQPLGRSVHTTVVWTLPSMDLRKLSPHPSMPP